MMSYHVLTSSLRYQTTLTRLNGIHLFYTLFGYGPVRNIGNVFENLHVGDFRGD